MGAWYIVSTKPDSPAIAFAGLMGCWYIVVDGLEHFRVSLPTWLDEKNERDAKKRAKATHAAVGG